MLTRIQTRERNALRALAQWEANLSLTDTNDNFRADELACMEYDSVMQSFNESRECSGIAE